LGKKCLLLFLEYVEMKIGWTHRKEKAEDMKVIEECHLLGCYAVWLL
jgi:hypothetical protein